MPFRAVELAVVYCKRLVYDAERETFRRPSCCDSNPRPSEYKPSGPTAEEQHTSYIYTSSVLRPQPDSN